LRFGDAFENGYRLIGNFAGVDFQRGQRELLREFGLFRLRNIPTNLYYYFVKGPDPVIQELSGTLGNKFPYILKPPYIKVANPGVSFFVVAPIFLYVFRSRLRQRMAAHALLAVLCVLIFLLSYYWNGWFQVGPRYMLDVLPFAYLLLLFSFPDFKLSGFAQLLIVASAFFNLYLLSTVTDQLSAL
jgi:hypothetical protein